MKHIAGILAASALGLGALVCSTSANAVTAIRTITIDENGNGVVTGGVTPVTLAFGMAPDPGPGGLASVLTYTLPAGFTVVPGDVHLTDADALGAFLDVIRFNQVVGEVALPGTIAFYSDNIGGADALADTLGPPGSQYANLVTLPEVGPEGANGATYTPTAGQPGFVSGFVVTYNFISDGALPEPASWAMMLMGFAGIGYAMRRRKAAAFA